jgi:hypothetical protein
MLLATLIVGAVTFALDQSGQGPDPSTVKVFLDCAGADVDDEDDDCHLDYLREEIEFVEYVRDRSDAEVHVLVTRAETGARGQEYTLAFIGQQRFETNALKVTVTTDATTVGLLSYVTRDTIPPGLSVTAEQVTQTAAGPAATSDPWNRWIFSLNGSGSLEVEESTSERDWGLEVGADRITPEWKLITRKHSLRRSKKRGRDRS